MRTLTSIFEESVLNFPNNILLWEKKGSKYRGSTYKEVQHKVYCFALGLRSLGIKPNEKVAILSEGRSDWFISEMGILFTDSVCVPISTRLSRINDLEFQLKHSESVALIFSASQEKKLSENLSHFSFLRKLIPLDSSSLDDDRVISYEEIRKLGEERMKVNGIEELTKLTITPDSLVNIMYSPGTSGDSKAVMLSHKNYVANVLQAQESIYFDENDVTLAILPWDHTFAHTTCLYCIMSCGASVGAVELGKTPRQTANNVYSNLKELRPTVIMTTPALLREVRANIYMIVKKKGRLAHIIFIILLRLVCKYYGISSTEEGKGWRILLRPFLRLFDKAISHKIREEFGGRLKMFVGGTQVFNLKLQRFFLALGIPIWQGYGLIEASPIVSVNNPDNYKLTSVGQPIANLDVRIVDAHGEEVPRGEKGEITCQGDNVIAGYWKDDDATEKTIRNGWLYTQDIGHLDRNNFLHIHGQSANLLIGTDGETFSPENMESSMIDFSPYIEHVVLYNHRTPYTCALLALRKEKLSLLLNQDKISWKDESEVKKVLEAIHTIIENWKKITKSPARWLPSRICILNEKLSEENRLLTPMMKLVRHRVLEYFAQDVAFLTTPEAKNMVNAYNIKKLQELSTHQ